MNTARPGILLELKEARELLEKLRAEEKVVRTNGIQFYEPAGPKHDKFHRGGEFKYRYARTGNRFGKSEMGAAEDIAWLIGERPWYKKGDPARYAGIPKRSVRGVLVVENWKKADEIFTCLADGQSRGKLFKYLPSDKFHDLGKQGSNIDTIYVKSIHGGISMLRIMTVVAFKQDEMTGESSQWDFAHIDEPCPRDMWIAISRGFMDTGGKAWFTCTPLTELWINDFFIPGRLKMTDKSEPAVFGEKKNKLVITGSSYDNKHITRANIEEFASTLKKGERETRIYGTPGEGGGLVYPQFDYDVHVYTEMDLDNWMRKKGWEDMHKPPQDYTIRLLLDLHSATPDAASFWATGPGDYSFCFHEIFERRLLKFLAEDILETMDGRFWLSTLADPSAFKESPVDDGSWADDLAMRGIVCTPAPKELARGIREAQEFLAKRDERGRPKVRFSSLLTETLYEFDHYVWDPKKPDKPLDKDDHMMENFYRFVISGTDYIDLSDSPPKYVGNDEAKFDLSIPKQTDAWDIRQPKSFIDELKDIYEP